MSVATLRPLPSSNPKPRRRIVRWIARVVVVLVVLLAAVAGAGTLWLRSVMKSSLPQVSGERRLPGLGAAVTVERDALGVPTIRARDRVDAARALGFLHAQERFFQMDLLRRQAAGELCELFGPVALEADKLHRVHRFRDLAGRIVAGLAPADRALLDAYTAGVEAGRAALDGKPFEYALLRTEPAPWRAEDTLLTVFTMYLDLEEVDRPREVSLGVMRDVLPPAVVAFLAPAGTSWDAPLDGGVLPAAPIPGPDIYDLRTPRWAPPAVPKAAALSTAPFLQNRGERDEDVAIGSNNWAVAGSRTADGHALLANDMHLGLRVPNTWYRASLAIGDAGSEQRVTGVTLPGTPFVAAGSTGRVAWGFTDSYIDWSDVVLLETDAKDPDVYKTPDGPRRLQHFAEKIRVKGGADVPFDVAWSLWGPVIGKDHDGRPEVLSWIAHHPEAVNFRLADLMDARTVDDAVEIAHAAAIPPENFVVADASGRIAWTIIGPVPRRVGFDGRMPSSWADGSRRWDGFLTSAEVPKIVDPPSGRLWTGNNRAVSGADLARLGDGGVWLGARAHQIHDDLFGLEKATAKDLLGIQLDDRAVFLERWRTLLLGTLTDQAVEGHAERKELRRIVQTTWTGRATIDSPAYRIVRAFRTLLRDQVMTALTARCAEADANFDIRGLNQIEEPLWALATARPLHLLNPRYKTWDEQLLAAADAVLEAFGQGASDLAARTWGERNVVQPRHPLSYGIPLLGRWIDMPPRSLPGDAEMPRVQSPNFGASERFVVSPGHEEAGIFHMPVGESGNPLSPHYGDGHRAWEEGTPTPFLPGPAVEVLKLVP